jgi:hypothetical protein
MTEAATPHLSAGSLSTPGTGHDLLHRRAGMGRSVTNPSRNISQSSTFRQARGTIRGVRTFGERILGDIKSHDLFVFTAVSGVMD